MHKNPVSQSLYCIWVQPKSTILYLLTYAILLKQSYTWD